MDTSQLVLIIKHAGFLVVPYEDLLVFVFIEKGSLPWPLMQRDNCGPVRQIPASSA